MILHCFLLFSTLALLGTSNELVGGCDEHLNYMFYHLYSIVFFSVNFLKTPNLSICQSLCPKLIFSLSLYDFVGFLVLL